MINLSFKFWIYKPDSIVVIGSEKLKQNKMVWWRFLGKNSGFFRLREIGPKYRVFFDEKKYFLYYFV